MYKLSPQCKSECATELTNGFWTESVGLNFSVFIVTKHFFSLSLFKKIIILIKSLKTSELKQHFVIRALQQIFDIFLQLIEDNNLWVLWSENIL